VLTKLRTVRLSQGLRQVDVESMTLGLVSQRDLSAFEHGLPCSMKEAEALCGVFNLSPDELGLRIVENRDKS
jgi:hypothetical protein